ncbi:MAG: radical SAM protein [Clostridiales bacterium]|nr:radical SAM protein [Candidatus Coliplasma equi]
MNKISDLSLLADYRESVLKVCPPLKILFLELTSRCNAFCRHCGSDCEHKAKENELSTAEIKNFLIYIKNNYDVSKIMLCITGGEPLLREDFFEIVSFASSLGFGWGMTTNGILIDENTAKKLKESGMKTVSVSLDGLKDYHDWFRRVNSFDRSVAAVKALAAQGFYNVQITTVVTKKNIDDLAAMYEFFKTLGADSWRIINIEPIGRAKELESLYLGADDYKTMFSFIKEHRNDLSLPTCYGCSHYLGEELERTVRDWYFLCNAGVYTASITSTGDIVSCLDVERRHDLAEGNIRKDDFKNIWQNGFEKYRKDKKIPENCLGCDYFRFCDGGSFHTRDFDKNTQRLCFKGVLFD